MRNAFSKPEVTVPSCLNELVAYRQIKSANLTTHDEKHQNLTTRDEKHQKIPSVNKVIKIFLEDGEIPIADMKELHIKQASACHTQNY